MADDNIMTSSSSQEKMFDPKKLGRLALARRAMSMESEVTRSSRWNLPPEEGVHRSICLDAHVSTSSLELSSLRALRSSPNKRKSPNAASDNDANRLVHETKAPSANRSEAASTDSNTWFGGQETRSRSHGPSKSACSPPETSQLDQEEANCTNGSNDSRQARGSASRTQRTSIRQGVDEKAIAALSELARRRREEAPPILLPSNRPFLVGENANRLAAAGQQIRLSKRGVPTEEPMNASKKRELSIDHPQREAPDITVLSKLLFFGGTTPHKVSVSNQSTPEAVLSPDLTTVSQSDSCSSGDEHTYLLQLGHIMGEVSPLLPPLQPRAGDFEETASTVSSLDQPEVQDIDFPPRRHILRCFLFSMACMMLSVIIFCEREHITTVHGEMKQTFKQHVEGLMKETSWTVRLKAIDWADDSFDGEQALIMLARWKNLTFNAYSSVMDFILEPTNPPEQMIRARNQFTTNLPWTLPDVFSTAVVLIPEQATRRTKIIRPRSQRTVRSPLPDETYTAVVEVLADKSSEDLESDEVEQTTSPVINTEDIITTTVQEMVEEVLMSKQDHVNVMPHRGTMTLDSARKDSEDSTDVTQSAGSPLPDETYAAVVEEPADTESPEEFERDEIVSPVNNDDTITTTALETVVEAFMSVQDHHHCMKSVELAQKFPEDMADETRSNRISAKDRLQAAAMQDLLRVMRENVSMQLGPPRNTLENLSLTAHVALRSDCVVPVDDSPSKHVNPRDLVVNSDLNFWSRKETPFLSLKLGIMNIDNKKQQERVWSDDIFSCVLSRPFAHQCLPSGSMNNICCAPQSVDEHAAALDDSNRVLRMKEEEDGFLQKPLIDVVGDFFRERRKRRQDKRRERKQSLQLGN